MKGATKNAAISLKLSGFNPRSREGSDNFDPHSLGYDLGFNPRSREGSDVSADGDLYLRFRVSIHAPVKGATHDAAGNGSYVAVSIHAPVKGATSPFARGW